MKDKINVTSMVNGTISINFPQARLNKVWAKKGQTILVDSGALLEAFYEPGVEYMFKNGILYTDDMDFKVEVGLEAPGTVEPTNVKCMDTKYLNRVLKLMPFAEMKAAIDAMSDVQRKELVDYAIAQNDVPLNRLEVLSQKTGIDVLQVINLNRQKGE